MTEFSERSKKLLSVMGCDENIIRHLESGYIHNIRCTKDYLDIIKDILETENIGYTITNSNKAEKFIVILEHDAEDYF